MSINPDYGMGIRLSADGAAMALDWNQDGKVLTTILPSAAVPNVLHMLLDAAEKAGERQAQKPTPTSKPGSVFRASDMQLLTTDSGASWILRIDVGTVRLDFALTKDLVKSLQKTIATPPAAKSAKAAKR